MRLEGTLTLANDANFARNSTIMDVSLAVTNVTAKPNIAPLTVAGG
jgi:hypothetical protein